MPLAEAISTALRKTFVLQGRATRSEFWWTVAGVLAFWIIGGIVLRMIGIRAPLNWFALAAALIPLVSAGVRRLHDTGQRGWWLLLPAVTIPVWLVIFAMTAASVLAVRPDPLDDGKLAMAATAVMFVAIGLTGVWLTRRGVSGPNKYGPNPAEVSP